jgi:hypothetical protein
MESYRFFGVTDSGAIVSDRSFDCADDVEARDMAVSLKEPNNGIEVWDVSRCVCKIAKTPSQNAAREPDAAP